MSILTADTIKSIILGHAVADALGVPVEFSPRHLLDQNPVTDMMGYGTYPFPEGCWSDDTSMTLAALESLSTGKVDFEDIMQNFGKWYYKDEFTPTGKLFDIGLTCTQAIENYFTSNKDALKCGLSDEMSNGNGSLMRIIPFVLYSIAKNGIDNLESMVSLVKNGSDLTHSHRRSEIACEIYSSVLCSIISDPSKESISTGISKYFELYPLPQNEMTSFGRISYDALKSTDRSEIKSTGYVIDTLEAALWCLINTDDYSECVLEAVNLGSDTDTVAAVAGGLAGALYSRNNIPGKWLEKLKRVEYIEEMCDTAAKAWGLE